MALKFQQPNLPRIPTKEEAFSSALGPTLQGLPQLWMQAKLARRQSDVQDRQLQLQEKELEAKLAAMQDQPFTKPFVLQDLGTDPSDGRAVFLDPNKRTQFKLGYDPKTKEYFEEPYVGFVAKPGQTVPRLGPGETFMDFGPTGAPRRAGVLSGSQLESEIQEKAETKSKARESEALSARVVNQDIGRAIQILEKNMSKKGPTTAAGGLGQVISKIPFTKSFTDVGRIETQLEAIRSNISRVALQKMRDSSPTGGALGQVSEREHELLMATYGTLDPFGDPVILLNNFKRLANIFRDIVNGENVGERYDLAFDENGKFVEGGAPWIGINSLIGEIPQQQSLNVPAGQMGGVGARQVQQIDSEIQRIQQRLNELGGQ